MYDKSIQLEFGLYHPIVRDEGVIMRLEPCLTLLDAQRVLNTLPRDFGETGPDISTPLKVSPLRDRFEEKLEAEDEFEEFLSKAEVCR